MSSPIIFRDSLIRIKKERNLSLTNFSKETCVARSTLQAILRDGNTTLDTACRISNSLNMPLSSLIDEPSSNYINEYLNHLLNLLDWYTDLPASQQELIQNAVTVILDILRSINT